MQGVTFGTSTDREREPEYLAHFLKEVEKGVTSILRMENLPLILAGVEYEMGLYRKENTYQRLLEKGINGAPDHVALRTLHQHAMGIVMQVFSEPLRQALADFEKNGRISFSAPDIVTTSNGPAVFHADSTPVNDARPARAGEVLTLQATSLGPRRPRVGISPLEVTVGGKPAAVVKAVSWPALAETYQVDFRMPDGAAPGTATIQLTAAWVAGSEVKIAVQ